MVREEKYKKIIRDTFLFLLVVTICYFYVYRHYTPEMLMLVMATLLLGLAYFYPYYKKILRVGEVENVGERVVIVLVGFIFYSIFLNWVFPKLPFDEFMFFVLLFYVPISIALELEPKIPIAVVLILLAACSVTLVQGFKDYADRIAVYAYTFLVIGVILLSADSFRMNKRVN